MQKGNIRFYMLNADPGHYNMTIKSSSAAREVFKACYG